MKYLTILFGFILGNFIFQYFLKQPDYTIAIKITCFQAATILTFFIIDKLSN
jgi:hypothetical protein